MPSELVEMAVESVRIHMLSSQHVVILKEAGRDRFLPIWIGPWEANAIAMKLQGIAAERPLTHDVFAATLHDLGAELEQVIITSLAEETFHARLLLRTGDRVVDVDARPSDAIALAVRTGARIFAAQDVLDRAGVESETQDEEKLDVFREFVNSLELEDEPREGPPRSEG